MKHTLKNLIYYSLTAIFLLACNGNKIEPVDPDPDPTPGGDVEFSVSIKAEDGERDRNEVKKAMSMVFTAHSTNEGATYMIVYSINGGPNKTVNSIWDGKERSISYDLLPLTEYGVYIIQGYMCDTEDKTSKVEFEQTLWMKYVPIEVNGVKFSSVFGDIAFDNAKINIMEEGVLKVDYSPVASGADFSVVAADPDIVSFDMGKASYGNNVFTIPYKASASAGHTRVTFRARNGEELLFERETDVTVEPGEVITNIEAVASAGKVAFKGCGVDVNVSANTDYNLGGYVVDYYIDNEKVYSQDGLDLPYADNRVLDISSFSVGEHVFTVKFNSTKYHIDEVSVSSSFYIADPVLSFHRDDDTGPVVATVGVGGSVDIECSSDGYGITVSGIPANYMGYVKLEDKYEPSSIQDDSGWIFFRPQRTGEGNLVMCLVGSSPETAAKFTLKRFGSIMVKLSYINGQSIQADVAMAGVSGVGIETLCKFHGFISYDYYTFEGDRQTMRGDFIWHCYEYSQDQKSKQNYISWTSSSSNTAIDFSQEYQEISSDYEWYGSDSDEGRGYIETIWEQENYIFVMDEINIVISTDNRGAIHSSVSVNYEKKDFPSSATVNVIVRR